MRKEDVLCMVVYGLGSVWLRKGLMVTIITTNDGSRSEERLLRQSHDKTS